MNFGLKVNQIQINWSKQGLTPQFTKASHNFITFIDNILSDSFLLVELKH